MTPTAQIAAIRQRAEQATPGKWSHEPHGGTTALYSGRRGDAFLSHHGLRLMNLDDGDKDFIANAEFIAHAREDIPFLLQQWDAHQSALRALVAQFKEAASLRPTDVNGNPCDYEGSQQEAIGHCAAALERLLESEP